MTLRDLIPLAITVAVPFAVLYGLHRLSRWRAGRQDPINDLIAKNAFSLRKGMERVDWSKMDRVGELQWLEILRAQRKARKKLRKTKPNIVLVNSTRRRA